MRKPLGPEDAKRMREIAAILYKVGQETNVMYAKAIMDLQDMADRLDEPEENK